MNNLIEFNINEKGNQNLVFLAHHICPSNAAFFLKTGPLCKQ